MSRFLALICLFIGTASGLADGVDLAKEYPATLDWSEGAVGRDWTCGPGDVWQLSSFKYSVGDDLKAKLGLATVVFGKHGTNAVWAVVVPVDPGKLRSSASTETENVTSIWLRFNPALIGELFPRESVTGHGPADATIQAKRICNWKINGSWQANNLPVIPQRNSIVFDAETADGPRRFLMIDTQADGAKYEPWFADRALPKLVEVDQAAALAALETVWRAFDTEYAMFVIKPQVDWSKLRDEYRLRMKTAKTSYEVAVLLAEMLAKLEDLHIGVRVGQEWVPCFDRPRPLNASWEATEALIGTLQHRQRALAWGRTSDDIGYINAYTLGNEGVPDAFDDALESLGDTWALIIDLRFNGGGDETLAQRMAGRFIDRRRVYSYSQYRRETPKHTDLTERLSRECEPRGPWRYESPVVVLIGQKTMSSAESFVFMLAACPQVVTMGDRTAGSSGNPRQVDAGMGIVVTLPRWLDLGPDGKPFDAVGIQPAVPVSARADEFTNTSDPVLRSALERLRQQPQAERQPGKRR